MRSEKGGGNWTINSSLPKSWQIHYKELTFNLKLMGTWTTLAPAYKAAMEAPPV